MLTLSLVLLSVVCCLATKTNDDQTHSSIIKDNTEDEIEGSTTPYVRRDVCSYSNLRYVCLLN
jgi:hypothetical protein